MQHRAKYRLAYVLSDLLSAGLAWFVFNLVRYYTLPYNYSSLSLWEYFAMPTVVLGQVAFPMLLVAMYALSGYYNKVFFKSRLDDVLNAAGWGAIGSIAIFFTALFNDQIDDRMGNLEMVSLLWLLLTAFPSVARVQITRRIARKIWNRDLAIDAVIVGTSPQAVSLARDLDEKYRTMGFRIVGFLGKDSGKLAKKPVYPLADIEEVSERLNFDAYIVVPDDDNKAIDLYNKLLHFGKPVYIQPDIFYYLTSRPRTSMVAGQVLIDVSRASIPESTHNLKRVADVIVSSLALVALSPVFAVLAILIKADSKGPVFYRQERIGYKQKPFKICKFRSMRTDAEKDGPLLSSAADPRVTAIGRVMRKYRLDELPQFWNVLKGEMSLVGPRPERQFYLSQIAKRAPYYSLVHQVRPGITSWGMVKYGYASSVDEMLERLKYDLLYVDNVSLAVDMKILFYTVRTVVTGQGV